VKRQNQALAQKFGISGFPTLVVIDSSEKVLGSISGYNPGSGPDAVISQLKAFNH
jgi:thioredoxin-related protein